MALFTAQIVQNSDTLAGTYLTFFEKAPRAN